MKNKLLITGIMTLLTIISIQAAMAITPIETDTGNWVFKELSPGNIVGGAVGGTTLTYFDDTGITQTIDISSYPALDAQKTVGYAITPAEESFLDQEDMFWVCDNSLKLLCQADFSTGTINTYDLTSVWSDSYMILTAITQNYWYFQHGSSSSRSGGVFIDYSFIGGTPTIVTPTPSVSDMCYYPDSLTPTLSICGDRIIDYFGSNEAYIYVPQYQTDVNPPYSDTRFKLDKYYANSTHFQLIGTTGNIRNYGWEFKEGAQAQPGFCEEYWIDGENESFSIICGRGKTTEDSIIINKDTLTVNTINPYSRDGKTLNSYFYDQKVIFSGGIVDYTLELIIESLGNYAVYNSSSGELKEMQLEAYDTSSYSQYQNILVGETIIVRDINGYSQYNITDISLTESNYVFGSTDITEWIRMQPNLMATWYDDTIYWYSSEGVEQSIQEEIYSAEAALTSGETDSMGTNDIYWICDNTPGANKMCVADYSEGDIDQIDVNSVVSHFNRTLNPFNLNTLEVAAITEDFYAFCMIWQTGNNVECRIYEKDLSNATTAYLGVIPQLKRSSNSYYNPVHTTYRGNNYFYQAYNRDYPGLYTVYNNRFTYDNTGVTSVDEGYIGYPFFDTNFKVPAKTCYPEDNIEVYCAGTYAGTTAIGPVTGSATFEDRIPYNNTFQGLDGLTNSDWYNYGGGDAQLIVNGSGPYTPYYFYEGTLITNESTIIEIPYERNNWVLEGGYILYQADGLGAFALSNNLTGMELNITPSINQTNYTAIIINETTNITFIDSELASLELLGTNKAIIGMKYDGDVRVSIYDYTNPTNPTNDYIIDINDNHIYSTSTEINNMFITTNDGVYIYANWSTTPVEIANDKYGILKSDRLYDVNSINETSAYVCDDNDEVDYYTIGENPEGSLGGGCYDIEQLGNYLFVDADISGINLFETTDKENPSYIATIYPKTSNLPSDFGDYIDININYLGVITGAQTFKLIDVTNPESQTEIATCNSGGAGGTITSIEYIGDNKLVAGTDGASIVICDTTNTDQYTNTEYYLIDSLYNETTNYRESIKAIEHDGTHLHIIGEKTYTIIEIGEEVIYENTPPTVDNVIVSTEEALLGQDVDVQIIAGNIEPLDVIHYGIKCNGTESTFTDTWDGIFTCTYTEPGIYNVTAAVTDNFHLGTWYDETIIQILVLDEQFIGGIMRVLVLDPEQLAIENATVNIPSINVTGTTSEYGTVTLITPEETTYSVTASAYGYYESTRNLAADGLTRIITLSPIAGEGGTALIVDIIDRNGAPVENALVSYTNIYTYVYDYGFTDGLGRIIFTGLEQGEITVSASKDDADGNELTTVADNQTTMLTITLQLSKTQGIFHVERNCVDNGLWLCGNVTWDCTEDSECLSNECGPLGECSRFNYSRCDYANKPRSGGCVVSLTINSWVDSLIDWFFRNLLVVIIFLVIIIGLGLALHSLRD
jgi:hypothetical protein